MAWKKSALKHSQTFSCAKFVFMDMLLEQSINIQLGRCAYAGEQKSLSRQ
jgi:hypothetical protein